MRSSCVGVFGALAVVALSACSVSTTSNSITFKTQKEFVDSSHEAQSVAWKGEPINITNDGVNPLTGDGGIKITVDPSATSISVKPIYSARADDDAHKSDADASIADAIQTFKVSSGGTINIECHHGQAHGTSGVATSGCKQLLVTLPAGSATTAHQLRVGDGNGGITFSGAIYASNLAVTESGTGDVDVRVNPTSGARVVVTGPDSVMVGLPSDFSAQQVVLNVEESDAAAAKARIVTTDFPGMESGKVYPAAGASSTAAAELNVQSKGILDSDMVMIHRL